MTALFLYALAACAVFIAIVVLFIVADSSDDPGA